MLNISELLRKNFLKKFENKTKIINMRRQATDTVTEKPIVTTYKVVMEKLCIFFWKSANNPVQQ